MPKAKKKPTTKKTANALPLGKFVKGAIRVVKKNGKRVIQFRKAK